MAGLEEKLVTQNSLFRQLKFGKDTPGQGDSREPFVNRDTLPGVTQQNPNLGLLGGNTDFLLRAGTLQRSAEDVSRMSQLLLTTGKGLLFTAKQNLLSRTNVKTQALSIGLNQGPYLPTSTIAQVGVAGLGFHLNKQGVNPFAATGTAAGEDGAPNNFLESIIGASKAPSYLSANIKGGDSGETNRLVQLRKYKIIGPNLSPVDRATNFFTRLAGRADDFLGTGDFLENKVADLIPNLNPELQANNISNRKSEILAYGGGPDAELGIGNTRIKRYYFSDEYKRDGEFQKKYFLLDGGQIESLAQDYATTKGKIKADFRKQLLKQQSAPGSETKSILSNSLDYEKDNIEQRVNLGNPGRNDKDTTSYVSGTGFGALDKVNALPLYQSQTVTPNTQKNDLVKFRIAAIDPFKDFKKVYIHFRAFIESFSDNYDSQWSDFKYMGRSETFYKYQGYRRTVNLGWKLAAQSREELIPMYKKLNYLQSILTGDYSQAGYLAGNLIDLTIGGYFWEQPGFLTSLNVEFPENSPYEIGIPDGTNRTSNNNLLSSSDVKELPMYLNVTSTFTPIQSFVSRKQQNTFNNDGSLNQFGDERYINLSNEKGATSYDTVQSVDKFNASSTSPVQTDNRITENVPNLNLPDDSFTNGLSGLA